MPFDAPLFYWYRPEDRRRQLAEYVKETFGIGKEEATAAVRFGEEAMEAFHSALREAGRQALETVRRENTWAVVLASRSVDAAWKALAPMLPRLAPGQRSDALHRFVNQLMIIKEEALKCL